MLPTNYLDQYSNPANWPAHYESTGPEIWRQSEGRVTHFVAGLGTSGTFVGTTRKLKELNSEIQAISMQPDSPFHGLEGLKHMATSIVPAIYDPTLADRALEVETEAAYAMAKQLAGRKICWWAFRQRQPRRLAYKSRARRLRRAEAQSS